MSLEDDLKARTSALISQQMANWVVEIQRAIQGHQASLVRALDELGETVARYDEKVDERSIGAADRGRARPAAAAGAAADYSGLKASLAAIEKGTNLSEVLTHLVGEVTKHIERAAMFIVKSNAAVGWYARGFDHPEAVKPLTIPLTADTVFRLVHYSRHATRGHVSHSPATAQALARLGGDPQGILAVPLILRDKVAAVLYCDTAEDEMPAVDGRRRRDPGHVRGQGDRRPERRAATRRPRPGRGRDEPRPAPPAPRRPGRDRPRRRPPAPARAAPAGPSTMLRPPTTPAGPDAGSRRRRPRRPAPTPPPAPPPPSAPPARASPRRSRRPTTTPSASRAWW